MRIENIRFFDKKDGLDFLKDVVLIYFEIVDRQGIDEPIAVVYPDRHLDVDYRNIMGQLLRIPGKESHER
ncbi:MAG: hypothetical protein EHM32_01140 [Spirochaetales bacterium]|nr:MAG: hypothetical protein EHM32_01140 [Spirochaetales bacterium]